MLPTYRKERALTGCASLTNTEREAAIAAKEQEEDMKPKTPANIVCFQPRLPKTRAICDRVTIA